MKVQYIWNEEIQNLIVLIYLIITNIRDNFIHEHLSSVVKILSIHQPNFPTTPIFMDGISLTNESLRYLNNIYYLFPHDISYFIMIYIIISSIQNIEWIRLLFIIMVWYIVITSFLHFLRFHNLLILLIIRFISSNQLLFYYKYHTS